MTKKKLFIITSIVFTILATASFLVGLWLAGWDFAGWFKTKYAAITYILLTSYAIFAISIWLYDKVLSIYK